MTNHLHEPIAVTESGFKVGMYKCRKCESVLPLAHEIGLPDTLVGTVNIKPFAKHGINNQCSGQHWDHMPDDSETIMK